MDGKTPDRMQENIEALQQLFPEVFEEGEIDFDKLKAMLGGTGETAAERYYFCWNGKMQALRLAQSSSTATLRPCRQESMDWDNTQNLYIEGDNLEVLKLLQKSYRRRVKLIYIDPPYNTGGNFVYPDDYSDNLAHYKRITRQVDEAGRRLGTNAENDGRFHSRWLNMIYPRLCLAQSLLREDGAIFISIDDSEQANLKKLCDEVFGEDNFVAQLIWKSKSGGANDSKFFAVDHEYVLVYARNIEKLSIAADKEAAVSTAYNMEDEQGKYALDRLDKQSIRYTKSLDYEIVGPDGQSYFPKHKNPAAPNATWRWSRETVRARYAELVFKDGKVYTKNYQKSGAIARSLLLEERFGRTRTGKADNFALFGQNLFPNPKPMKLIRHFLQLATDEDSLVLDFFSGSATTAHAVMQLNAEDGGQRRFIMVQLPWPLDADSEAYKAGYKTICDIGKERIRRAGEKLTANSKRGAKALDTGFKVFRLDSSSLKQWNSAAVREDENGAALFDMAQLEMELEAAMDSCLPSRSELDVVYEMALKLGLDLNTCVQQHTVEGKKVYLVGGGALMLCLDDGISEALAAKMIALKETLNPKSWKVVFKDAGFASDSSKSNICDALKLAGLNAQDFLTI